ncbi:dTDP-4-dehydrorhamnose 3,5-epimerase [Patescibacteria group bacterium]|nr:dTDP-4-dehydrorhamnose 3,5-epimerase [Patescibacteria group bacterium]MBU1029550.1 dTDP-4-dehydrorhamnose 3,5-epimerase [Patescibacteria group bacterium]MBU1915548.1 dTDP-4-dehydrorhamnose 3,5-epimerase [Patescibacteria group bacterium]
MNIIKTGIVGLVVIEPQVFGDERGWFMEMHSQPKFEAAQIESGVVQINHSFSTKGVLRGLHFQAPPHDQSKLVRCVNGRLFDAVVDIRRGSPTFGQWFGLELSAENKKMLFVPSGFAHGFCALEDCELMYLCGRSAYHKEAEGGLRYNAPEVGIRWPIESELVMNDRDRDFPTLVELSTPFVYQAVTRELV